MSDPDVFRVTNLISKNMKADEKKKVTSSPDGSLTDIRAWLAKNASDKNPRVLNRQNIQGELDLQPDENFSHLFLITVNGGENAGQLTKGFQNFNNAEWSPDGKKIICDSKAYSVHPDKERDSDIWEIDVATKQAKQILHWETTVLAILHFLRMVCPSDFLPTRSLVDLFSSHHCNSKRNGRKAGVNYLLIGQGRWKHGLVGRL